MDLTRLKAAALGERRRREALGGAMTGLVLLAGISLLIARGGGDDPGVEVRAASGKTAASAPAGPPPTTASQTATTTASSTPRAPAPPPPTTPPGQPAAADSRPPDAMVAEEDSSPPTTAAPWAYCDAGDYAVTVSTEKPSYEVAETVRATIAVTNTSGEGCYTRANGQTGVSWTDAAGRQLGGAVTHADCFMQEPCGSELAPGATRTESWCWDQWTGEEFAPPGPYRVEVYWMGASGSTGFEIAATGPGTFSPTGPRAGFTSC